MTTAEYLHRISYTGLAEPTLDVLTALVAAHNRSIPFENLDPLMGIPVVDLSPEALVEKLVRRRRGGYCFEHNGVMAHVLSQLGFEVDVLGGRVVWMNTSGELPAQTHQALAVTVPGEEGRYLVDVGFGGQTLSSPIRLETDTVQQTRHEPYRIREHGDGYVLESEIRDSWEPLYMFTTRPFPRSTVKSEAGMSQRIRSQDSSLASPSRSSRTTRGGTCVDATSPSTARRRVSGSASTLRRRWSTR